MSINELIPYLLTTGAGVVGTLLLYKTNSNKQGSEDLRAVMAEYKAMLLDTRAELAELKIEVDGLRKENETLRTNLLLFETSHSSIPLPMWMKDTNGVMLFVNSYYEDAFLKPRGLTIGDYVGATDYDIWPDEIAQSFGVNDRRVMRTKKPLRKIEMLSHPGGDPYWCDMLKYPRIAEGKVIGISGIILRTADEKEDLQ